MPQRAKLLTVENLGYRSLHPELGVQVTEDGTAAASLLQRKFVGSKHERLLLAHPFDPLSPPRVFPTADVQSILAGRSIFWVSTFDLSVDARRNYQDNLKARLWILPPGGDRLIAPSRPPPFELFDLIKTCGDDLIVDTPVGPERRFWRLGWVSGSIKIEATSAILSEEDDVLSSYRADVDCNTMRILYVERRGSNLYEISEGL